MLKTFIKLIFFCTLLLSLGSIGHLTTGCGTDGVGISGDEVADINPTEDNSASGSDDSATSSSGGSDDGSTTGSSSSDSSTSDSGSTSSSGGNALPGQASIPVILEKPILNEEDIYYSTSTESGITPNTGTAGAVEDCDPDTDGDGTVETGEECVVVMSTSEISEATETADRGSWIVDRVASVIPADSKRGSSFWNTLGTLFAPRTATADGTALDSICETYTCCRGAIQSDGSYECYVDQSLTPSPYTLYTYAVKQYVDENGDTQLLWSTPYIDSPNSHVKWHDGEGSDLVSAGGNVFAVSDATDSSDHESVKMADDGTGIWRVAYDSATFDYNSGDFVSTTEGLWENFSAEDSTQFDYDPNYSIFGLIGGENLYIKEMDSSGAIINEVDLGPGIGQLTKIKYTNSALYVSVEESDTANDAYIYYPLKGTIYEDTTKDWIRFIKYGDARDLDSRGYPLTHASTISFDFSNGLLAALYQDESGKYRIRGVDISSSVRFGGTREVRAFIGNAFEGVDIAFYDSDGATGKLLVLDSGNDMLWNLEINSVTQRITDRLNVTNGISIASGAIGFAFNSDKSRVYVVGSTEISVVALKDSTGAVVTLQLVATVNIADATGLSSKSFASSLDSSSIMAQGDTIFIGAQGIKSALTIDMNDITESEVTPALVAAEEEAIASLADSLGRAAMQAILTGTGAFSSGVAATLADLIANLGL